MFANRIMTAGSFGLEIHMENTENRSSFEKLAQAQYCTEML